MAPGYVNSRKRKFIEDDINPIENAYENHIDLGKKRKETFLPTKTRSGGLILTNLDSKDDHPESSKTSCNEEKNEIDIDTDENVQNEPDQPLSTLNLLVERNRILSEKKTYIGQLSAGLLESPEEKIANLRILLQLLEDKVSKTYVTIRKILVVSLVEIFNDILPSYEIKNVIQESVKLKRDTLHLQKYEANLLGFYKKFLCILDKYCTPLVKKSKVAENLTKKNVLAKTAVKALCDLIVAHPNFNYTQNIVQVLVPLLNNPNKEIRSMVKIALIAVLKDDKKKQITLTIMRLTNKYLKLHADIKRTEMLEIFLEMELVDVNLDREKIQNLKVKKMKQKKSKVLSMSKKELKRKKKMKELDNDMLEIKAEEVEQFKQRNFTEILKLLFNIYLRILKNSRNSNSKCLSLCLEGLSKFAHCTNLEYYLELVTVLGDLLEEDWLNPRDQLHCIRTIFSLLSGHGESIDIDPERFYNIIYENLFVTGAGKSHETVPIILSILTYALKKRRKSITNKCLISFIKRIATCSMQVLHNGSLAYLSLIKELLFEIPSIDIFCDMDRSEGERLPNIDCPEYSNASANATLFEMIPLGRHYHPVVRAFAKSIAAGLPISGNNRLPSEYAKLTPEDMYESFSMDNMEFKPSIAYLTHSNSKSRIKNHTFKDPNIQEEIKGMLLKCFDNDSVENILSNKD